MKTLNNIILALIIIGAINWGLIGLFGLDIVATLFGSGSALTRIIYTIVGICGLWAITFFGKIDTDDH
ncbi:hypothetical protein D3C73_1363160 [compost metagenome]